MSKSKTASLTRDEECYEREVSRAEIRFKQRSWNAPVRALELFPPPAIRFQVVKKYIHLTATLTWRC